MPRIHGEKKLDLKLINAYAAMGMSKREIALLCNIPRSSFEAICNRSPEVQEEIDKGITASTLRVASVVFEKATKAKDLKACDMWLKNHGDNWNRAEAIEIGGSIGVESAITEDAMLRVAQTYVKLHGRPAEDDE